MTWVTTNGVGYEGVHVHQGPDPGGTDRSVDDDRPAVGVPNQDDRLPTPISDSAFLHVLELSVRTELVLAQTSPPGDAASIPVEEWLSDPADAPRYEAGLRSLLGAVGALEDGSGRHRRTETEGW